MKSKKGASFGNILIGFLGIMVVFALLPTIATNQAVLNTKNSAVDDPIDISSAVINPGSINASVTFTLTNAPTGWKLTDSDCAISDYTFSNSTSDFTETTDYVITASAGTFTLKNTTSTLTMVVDDNTTYVDYDYCADGYIGDSGARGVSGLILIFASLGILGFSVWFFWKGFKG